MRDLLVTAIIFGAIPFILKRPHIGILVWSWIAYMNPHRMSWGFAYNMPFAAITAVAVFAGMLFSKEPKRVPWTPVTIVWLLFVAWLCITTIFALTPYATDELVRTLKIQLMTLITLMLMGTRERIHQLVWIIALSIGFFGIKGGLFVLATGGAYTVWGPTGSFITGNNEIALALIIVLPLMRYLQLQAKSMWLKHAFTVAMTLMLFSILASYSRGAFLAGAAMLLMLLAKSRHKIVIGIVLTVAVSTALVFMPDKWGERMGTIQNYEEDKSSMGRINAWWFAFNLAKDHPLVGGGFRTYTPDLFYKYAPIPDDFHDAHSIYFEVLAEHGFVGLILFLTMWLLTFRTGGWIVKRTRGVSNLSWARDLAAMIQVSLVGYAVGGAFLGLAYFDLPYHLMAILVLTRVIVERELSANEKKEQGSIEAGPTRMAARRTLR